MNRTKPLTRKSPMSGKQSGLTGVLSVASRQLKQRKAKSAKPTVFRSAAYLALVRKIPFCVNCGRTGHNQAAHSNQSRFGKGGSLKASDATGMALCSFPAIGVAGCHEVLDQGGKMDKATRNEFECQMIVLTVAYLLGSHQLAGEESIIAGMPSTVGSFESAALYLVRAIESKELQIKGAD